MAANVLEATPSPSPTCITSHIVLRSLPEIRAFLRTWRLFLTEAPDGRTVYNAPEYVLATLQLERNIEPRIVVLYRGKNIQAVVPFYFQHGRVRLQFSVLPIISLAARMLKLFGDSPIVADHQDAEVCIDQAMAALATNGESYDLMSCQYVLEGSPLWRWCLGSQRHGMRCVIASPTIEKTHRIRFPTSHAEYVAALSPNTRKTLRRQARKLLNEKGGRLVRVTTANQVGEFLKAVDSVYNRSWQSKTFGMRTRHEAKVVEFLMRIAEAKWLRSYVLYCHGQPIAFEWGYQYESIYYGQECAYSLQWSDWAPGAAMFFMIMEDFYQFDCPSKFDFGMGDAAYKQSLGNETLNAATVFLARSLTWRWFLAAQTELNRIYSTTRTLLVKSGLDRRIRRILKRQRRSSNARP
jgi:hypothetical protein